MKHFSRVGIVLGLIILVFLQNGCLPKPPLHQYGNLRLTILLAEDAIGSKAKAEDICLLKVKLTHKDDQLVKEGQFDFAGSNQEVAFDGLYPGSWKITVSGLDDAGRTIFLGTGEISVEPEEVKSVQLQLTPAPGTLRVGCDISQDPALSQQIKGTLYVYLNTDSGTSSKYYSMALDGGWIRGETALKEGTYQVKIAIPNSSSAIFVSTYYLVNIRAGEETTLNITADSAMEVVGVIDSSPPIPTGLEAVYNRDLGTVQISWVRGTEPDLQGYHLYRSNDVGLLTRVSINNSTNVSPPLADKVTTANFYNNRIAYAVSSFDNGGNESIWSEIVYVNK